jgi:hypothetical protein
MEGGIDAIRLAGTYVGRILPVQQVTRIEMVLNLKTAKALGLTVPQSILRSRASRWQLAGWLDDILAPTGDLEVCGAAPLDLIVRVERDGSYGALCVFNIWNTAARPGRPGLF